MIFAYEIKTHFQFLSDAKFRKRKWHIVDSMCDESYVFKRKNIQFEIEFSSQVSADENPRDLDALIKNNDSHWHINLYLDIDNTHENLAFSSLFPIEEMEHLRNELLLYELKDVNRQIEIYAMFIKRHLDIILEHLK